MNPRVLLRTVMALAFMHVAAAHALAQSTGPELGVYAGLDIGGTASTSSIQTAARNGIVLGGSLTIPIAPPFLKLGIGAQYVKSGLTLGLAPALGSASPTDIYNVNYLEIPVNVRVGVGGAFQVYALAGTNVGTLLTAAREVEGNQDAGAGASGEDLTKVRIALEFGGGASYALSSAVSVSLDARYAYTVNEQSYTSAGLTSPSTWTPRDLKLTSGLLFHL